MLLNSKIYGHGNHNLIVLHGFLGMSDNWKSYAKKMSENDFKVHLIDQRNHGDSFHNNEFNYEIIADDLKYYITHHDLNKFSLIGHSMGGKAAMIFGSLFPSYIDKLIVVDILPFYKKNDFKSILESLIKLDFNTIKSRKQADSELESSIPNKSLRGFLLKSLHWKNKMELQFKFNLKVLYKNLNEIEKALPKNLIYKQKTLFIRGEKSDYIIDSEVENLDKHFTDFQLMTIANAGHWVQAENPVEFQEKTLFFLKS